MCSVFSTSTWPRVPNQESCKKPATPSDEQNSREISSLKYRSNISLKSGGNKVFFHGPKIRQHPEIIWHRSANILPWRNWSNPIIPESLCANPRRFQRIDPTAILNFRAMDFIMKVIRFEGFFDLSTDVPDLAWVLLLGNFESCGSRVTFCEHFLFLGIHLGSKSESQTETECDRRFLKVQSCPELPEISHYEINKWLARI